MLYFRLEPNLSPPQSSLCKKVNTDYVSNSQQSFESPPKKAELLLLVTTPPETTSLNDPCRFLRPIGNCHAYVNRYCFAYLASFVPECSTYSSRTYRHTTILSYLHVTMTYIVVDYPILIIPMRPKISI
ncbi:GQ67_04757T0 [Komagataella phaffii]|nr:GQ67_04757T0 [Komagataella phaffii]AOA69643.1 GQ68_04729T0 [Komagataella phaffii GS115]